MDADGFTVVSKRRTAKKGTSKSFINYFGTSEESCEESLRKIQQAKEDLEASEGFPILRSNLDKIKKRDTCQISSIVCYGLGNVCSSRIARYQTGLLLCIQNYFDVSIEVFDPVFSPEDEKVLRSLNFIVLSKNEEGKRSISKSTLFYMPHCGKELYNNLLWANWTLNSLPLCVVLGNSFQSIVQNVPSRVLKKYYKYIERAEGLFLEYPVKFLVEHDDVFNDMSIHVLNEHINLIENENLFAESSEPDYEGCDIEIVRKEIINKDE